LVCFNFDITIDANGFVFNDSNCTLPNLLVLSYALAIATSGKAKRIFLAGFDGYGADDPRRKEVDNVFGLLKSCIWEIHDGDTVYNKVDMTDKDLEEFIDSFSTQQFELVTEFFDTMPKLRHVVNVTNPNTKVKSEVVIEGLDSFLV
jgi:hypothetical protein